MQITICHRVEFGPQTLEVLGELVGVVRSILKKETQIMKTLSDLEADVAAETDAVNSASTLLGGLSAQIADLKNNQTDPATAARIDALATSVETARDTLAAAIVANTPAAPPATGG